MFETFVAPVGRNAALAAMVSVRLRRAPFSAPLLAVILGVALAPTARRHEAGRRRRP